MSAATAKEAPGSRLQALGKNSRSWPTAYSLQPRAHFLGLTLVELLVAMAILVTVSASTALIFRGITRAWRTGAIRTERYQQVRLLFDLFDRELSSSVANPRFPFVGVAADDEASLHAGSVFDELIFVGTLPGRAGLVERGYWVGAGGELMCHDDESGDGDYLTGTQELCGQGVAGLALSYFDGTEWRSRWDGRPGTAEAGRLPKAVRVILTMGQQQSERFETVIHVPTS